jgi:hypothetical protein
MKELLILLMMWSSVSGQQKAGDSSKLAGPYLGQKPPGRVAEPFAEGIIAAQTNFHGSVVFSPDGNEAYWSVMGGGMKIMASKRLHGLWTKPDIFIPDADVPFISPDGNKFLFIAQRSDQVRRTEVVNVMERTPNGWTKARPLADVINAVPMIHWQLSVDRKGTLYFGARQNGSRVSRVYFAEHAGGSYRAPKIVEELKDKEAFSPFIAPDGSYLIVTVFRGGDLGLDILFRTPDGAWTKGRSIAESIGSSGEMLCPIVSSDGKYLFFLKGIGERTIPYWVSASFIEELRRKELNGE